MSCKGCGGQTPAEKIGSIVSGWKNLIWKSPEIEKEALRRIEICSKCPHLKASAICSQCGCYAPAKARSMVERCPINKWDDGE
jgi:hypothetical protein